MVVRCGGYRPPSAMASSSSTPAAPATVAGVPPWAGVVAAAVVLTRPALVRDTLLAYQDIPFAALIVGAVLLEARRPRRGVPVLAVLAAAGLFRPEAWFLSGLYVLYMWPAVPAR